MKPAWADENELSVAWWDFHCEHPDIGAELRDLAREEMALGFTRTSIKMLWEVVRWKRRKKLGIETLLNNNHTAYYSRWLMEVYEDLSDLFEIRSIERKAPYAPGEELVAA